MARVAKGITLPDDVIKAICGEAVRRYVHAFQRMSHAAFADA
jgi:DNA-binding transcriptional regulator YdaS (Cro superfamily)